jgi:hypothetical protein
LSLQAGGGDAVAESVGGASSGPAPSGRLDLGDDEDEVSEQAPEDAADADDDCKIKHVSCEICSASSTVRNPEHCDPTLQYTLNTFH